MREKENLQARTPKKWCNFYNEHKVNCEQAYFPKGTGFKVCEYNDVTKACKAGTYYPDDCTSTRSSSSSPASQLSSGSAAPALEAPTLALAGAATGSFSGLVPIIATAVGVLMVSLVVVAVRRRHQKPSTPLPITVAVKTTTRKMSVAMGIVSPDPSEKEQRRSLVGLTMPDAPLSGRFDSGLSGRPSEGEAA